MTDLKFFQLLLGATDPWTVGCVEIDQTKQIIVVRMDVDTRVPWGCPEPGCSQRMQIERWERGRRWRHLDTQQFRTYLEADLPIVSCPTHGGQQVRVPWAQPYMRQTALFEELAILLLQAMPTEKASERLGLSWDQLDGIKQRAVQRGLLRRESTVMKHLGVDEKHAGLKLWLTIVSCTDGDKARVVYVAQGKDQKTLDPFWQSLNAEQLQGIESISMDMSEAYSNSVLEHVPQGEKKLVYDRYHVAQQMGKAVDEVRRQEAARLDGEAAKAMKGTRFWWLYSEGHLPEDLTWRFRRLRKMAKKTAKAWEFKALLRDFWDCPDEPTGRHHLREWLQRALRSSLEPVRRVAKMCKDHLENLLTYFDFRSTNASAEAVNSRLQSLIHRACGFRNPQRLIAEIFFHFGGLDLMPRKMP
jgi:transposase